MAVNKRFKIKGRLSFEHIFEPNGSEGTKPAYSATLLLPKDDPQIQTIKDEMLRVAKEKWRERGPQILKGLIAEGKVCLRDGDLKTYNGYEGMMYLTSRSSNRPYVVDRRVNPVAEADGLIYSGGYVYLVVEFWAQDNANGKRINCKLLGVQFIRDGDRFAAGSGPATAADFDDLGEEGDDIPFEGESSGNPWD